MLFLILTVLNFEDTLTNIFDSLVAAVILRTIENIICIVDKEERLLKLLPLSRLWWKKKSQSILI